MNVQSLRDRLVEATGDRYIVEGELGRGGMAVVFAATDVRLKRAVAIKALPPELAFRNDVKTRFMREAQMAAALSHPHIVPIYAVDEFEGLVYMVMGRVRGESLAERLHREGRLSFDEARRILRETADALAHAHAHGVIHRDIKPDNILLDEKSGNVLVTDFGIARAMESDARITVTGVAVGTPAYMSPEQARGDDDVDGRADVYALGVVGFQMLAGEPPFTAPNTPALLLKHISEPPPLISTRRTDIPAALAYAVERALAKGRGERWPSAAAFRDALADDAVAPASYVTGVGVSQTPAGERIAASLQRAREALQAHPAQRPAESAPLAYPAWRGGDASDQQSWREAKGAWREKIRAQRAALRANRDIGNDIGRDIAREVRDAVREHVTGTSLPDRVRAFQRRAISSAFLMLLLFVINAATGHVPWFIFAWIGISIGVVVRALSLWQDGVRIRDLFRRPSRIAELEDVSVRSANPSAVAEARARALVGSDVLAGRHGDAVRRAADAERVVQETLRSLAPADRAQLPGVETTLRSLVERVGSLAQTLHSLDADVRPEQLAQLDARLADARALPERSPDRDRRVTLLERQRTQLNELAERRDALAGQLESASLVLQTIRLDLLRLRSAGIGNASADVSGVTQEARALSKDIGRVLDAAAEVRKL